MSELSLDSQIDFRFGLNNVSYLELGDAEPKLPEKSAMTLASEPISSHLDALWSQFNSASFMASVCCQSQQEVAIAMELGSYNAASSTLDWFKEQKTSLEPDLAERAQSVLDELAAMEIECQINRKLLVQP